MWIFTEVADWFDKTSKDNDAWIDSGLQPWVGSTLYEDSPWYRNVGIYAAAGTLYSLNKFTGTVASGFVDVLRIGDGVQEGGWGYGKDALRLLMVVGPAFRAARWATTLIPAVDELPMLNNCSWIGATRMVRWTGIKPMAALGDLAKSAGLGSVSETGGAWADELLPALRKLGGSARLVTTDLQSIDDVAKVVAENPNAATMFSVEWQSGGQTVGHSLFGVRNLFGGMTIIDRSGRAVQSLAELESVYTGISKATVYGSSIIVDSSLVVRSIGTLPTMANILSQANSGNAPDSTAAPPPAPPRKASKTAAKPAGSSGASSGVLTITTTEICIQANSDVPLTCSPVERKTYKVGAGESLQLIAQRVYGNVAKWQQIASMNGIKPPKYLVVPGQILVLP